jgi:hypothetical protein
MAEKVPETPQMHLTTAAFALSSLFECFVLNLVVRTVPLGRAKSPPQKPLPPSSIDAVHFPRAYSVGDGLKIETYQCSTGDLDLLLSRFAAENVS